MCGLMDAHWGTQNMQVGCDRLQTRIYLYHMYYIEKWRENMKNKMERKY